MQSVLSAVNLGIDPVFAHLFYAAIEGYTVNG
jgi:hypothetical protein